MNKTTSSPIITINNLSKAYTIGHQSQAVGTSTFRDALVRSLKKPATLFTGEKMDKEQFWALKGISLDIQRGDTIGLIGRNGSGKSTLLKVLSRIVEPTGGTATLHGRVASLLEVGTGFHPELTGRENIFFNGAILGMARKEITLKFDDIVAFSGVEKFLDTPVKFYSSGMYVRLAFAIAAHLDPDILIVDEVLAVGDAEFQKKSLGKMKDVTQDAERTVIFVSHSMDSIHSICNKCVWLQDGKIQKVGPTQDVVEAYMENQNNADTTPLSKRENRRGSGEVKATKVHINNTVEKDGGLEIGIELTNATKDTYKDAKLSLDFYDNAGNYLSNATNHLIDKKLVYKPGKNLLTVSLKGLNLVPGSYSLNIFIASDSYNTKLFDWVEGAASFVVPAYDFYGVGFTPTSQGRFVYLAYDINQE